LSCCIARRAWRTEIASEDLSILTEPVSVLAERVLARLHRKAQKQGAGFRQLAPEERHQLRITLKKLRYAAEFFHPLYEGRKAKRYIGQLSKLQDALGHQNDAAMTLPLLQKIEQDADAPDVHKALGVVIGWQARDVRAAAKPLRQSWRSFKGVSGFWGA
jgi:CHAD domain-containing protein